MLSLDSQRVGAETKRRDHALLSITTVGVSEYVFFCVSVCVCVKE